MRSGVHLATGEACAVKCLTVDSRVLDEVALHGELQHANVVVLLGHVLKKAQVFVTMELCGGGDLYGCIRARAERPFSYVETRTYLLELVQRPMYIVAALCTEISSLKTFCCKREVNL